MRKLLNRHMFRTLYCLALGGVFVSAGNATDAPSVHRDPLVRMPGTQPDQRVVVKRAKLCLSCHAKYDPAVEPGFNWQGSMMAHAARDFLFWPAVAVAAQDSMWALGSPNAADLCLRCHLPRGWLAGRSDPPNASAMQPADFDGVQCDFCHRLFDPFFAASDGAGLEGGRADAYWDEAQSEAHPSGEAVQRTLQHDAAQAAGHTLFNGAPLFDSQGRLRSTYTESGGGQYFVSNTSDRRASFADGAAPHGMLYSRYHKGRYICGTCHDVSNPVLANLKADPTGVLPTEERSAHGYGHIERTFSEFMLSVYAEGDGAPGGGAFAPETFTTSRPGNRIATCQDCHMRDVVGRGAKVTARSSVPIRPTESTEHPRSGVPLHDFAGGNAFVGFVLASAVPGSPNYNAVNAELLGQGAEVLTMDLSYGVGVNPEATLAAVDRAKHMLASAASIDAVQYDAATGRLMFRVVNHTGHKLISGFPEGRRMFVNIRARQDGKVVYEVNAYDAAAGALRGLPHAHYSDALPPPAPLGEGQVYRDELVYEMQSTSSVTQESHTFHSVLADGRYKDNRIPPRGFRIAEAAARMVVPHWQGQPAPAYFTPEEYAGGYDAVDLRIVPDADVVEVNLYYQTTSREYVEFLRDEINGTGHGPVPYVIQGGDPFFARLRAWGDTVWALWLHNKDVPGAAPIRMVGTTVTSDGRVHEPEHEPR